MSDEEAGESTATAANTAGAVEDEPADAGPSAVGDVSTEAAGTEDVGGDEEEQEQEEEEAVPEDTLPGADESEYVPPEPESVVLPLEEAGTPEDKGGDEEEEEQAAPTETMDEQQQQFYSTEEQVTVPAVTDELVTVEEAPLEPQEIAASPIEDGQLEVPDDGYKDTVSQPSDVEGEGSEADEDRPQSAEQIADLPDEVLPYPSADKIDVLEIADELDKLAVLDGGDMPDPTRAVERVGTVKECPEVPVPPPLLVEGRDDIESPRDEPVVPSVLVCVLSFCTKTFLWEEFWSILITNTDVAVSCEYALVF